jgi:hypothetical protein
VVFGCRWGYCCHLWCVVGACLWCVVYRVRCGHGRGLCGGRLCLVCGGYDGFRPLTFKISYSIYVYVRSSHIIFSYIIPVPFIFFTFIISPLSYICSPHRFANLYASTLLAYSVVDRYMLHFSGPLVLLIAAYNFLRAALEAHSMIIRSSPNGAATRMHPVRSANYVVIYFATISFHSSTFPWKRFSCVRLFTWL